AQNQNQYRAHFSNSAGEATSKVVILTVHYAPMITKQPHSVTVNEGEAAIFEAASNANPAASVKWEVSVNGGSTWTAVKEATSPTLTIASAKKSERGHLLRATFTNSLGNTATAPATLTVQKAPSVTKEPVSRTAVEGENAVFEASASGFPA